MALLTIPTTPQRGAFQSYSLNQADLILLVTDNYFKQKSNWKKVILTYVSSISNQISLISFSPDEIADEVTAPGFFSSDARTIFRVTNISIYDKQNGRYRIESTSIPNVNNYNLVFGSNLSGSWYNMYNSGGNNLQLVKNYSETSLIAGTSYNADYDSAGYYALAIDGDTGSPLALANLVNNFKVKSYTVNAAKTKIYVVGQFGTNYGPSSLPPVSTGPNYTVNPSRVLSIDVATSVVTWLFDVEDAGTQSGMTSFIWNLIVDDVLDICICIGGSKITAYNMTTQARVWTKNAGVTPPDYRFTDFYSRKTSVVGSDFYIVVDSYDGVTYPLKSLIRVSLADGNNTNSVPSMPSGASAVWAVSPISNRVIMGGNNQLSIFDGTSWNTVSFTGVTNAVNSLAATETYIIVMGDYGSFAKVDYTGANVPGFTSPSWPSYTAPSGIGSPMAIIGTKLWVKLYSENSATINTTTGIVNYNVTGAAGGFVLLNATSTDIFYISYASGSSYAPLRTSTPQSLRDYGSIGLIDIASATLQSHFAGGQFLNASGNGAAQYSTSSLWPELVFFVGGSTQNISPFNTATGTNDNTWPTYNSGVYFYSNFIDGNYLYLAPYSAGTYSFTDSLGVFNGSATIARIDLTTKTFDRSFNPVIPGCSGYSIYMSATDDYIYCCPVGNFQSLGVIGRIKKSDFSTQIITPADLGITTPYWCQTGEAVRINFNQVEPNKLIVFADQPFFVDGNKTTFTVGSENKPYLIVAEDTLAQVGTQPGNATERFKNVIFNPTNMELAGGMVDGSNSYFGFYDLTTHTRTLTVCTYGPANIESTSGRFYNISDRGNPFELVVIGADYYLFTVGFLISNFKPYCGILKMNPIGIISA